MNTDRAVQCLAALAQDSRLEVFRLLVAAGPAGLHAGDIADRLAIPASTLSFHLKTLSHAGLIAVRAESRFNYYSPNFETMNALLGYLSDDCCGGRACLPAASPSGKRMAR